MALGIEDLVWTLIAGDPVAAVDDPTPFAAPAGDDFGSLDTAFGGDAPVADVPVDTFDAALGGALDGAADQGAAPGAEAGAAAQAGADADAALAGLDEADPSANDTEGSDEIV